MEIVSGNCRVVISVDRRLNICDCRQISWNMLQTFKKKKLGRGAEVEREELQGEAAVEGGVVEEELAVEEEDLEEEVEVAGGAEEESRLLVGQ